MTKRKPSSYYPGFDNDEQSEYWLSRLVASGCDDEMMLRRNPYAPPRGCRYGIGPGYTNSKTQPLATPLYSDSAYANGYAMLTLYGHEQTTKDKKKLAELREDYSDRLWQHDHKKYEQAAKIADEAMKESEEDRRTVAWYEKFLAAFWDLPGVEIVHVLGGVNAMNLFEYYLFVYKVKKGK